MQAIERTKEKGSEQLHSAAGNKYWFGIRVHEPKIKVKLVCNVQIPRHALGAQ